jgi:hypothetical protein
MRKRKSTRETKNMIQTALWLPRDMHELLKKAGGERGMGDEIRRRLEASFGAEQGATTDPKTAELLDKIARLALNTPLNGPWHADGEVFEVFKAAINATLSSYQPSGEATGPTGRLQDTYGQDATPETVGRILAGVTGTYRSR